MIQHLLPLQTIKCVRHAHVLKDHIVPARRTIFITIERTQVGVKPVSTSGSITRLTASPSDNGQIRRRCTEPLLLLIRTGRNTHQLTNFIGSKHQTVLDLLFAQP
ncbi:MAG: hypothetical protein ACD_34C00156G0001 [uncultured bacterium]|nr:MAG: hypothetical protein ACD_34C00156G0001 [uncultured bacterium]